jgi:hypothetical protein
MHWEGNRNIATLVLNLGAGWGWVLRTLPRSIYIPGKRSGTHLKADSHITCRAHAAPMLFPCHAVPLMVYNMSFSFELHSAAVSDSHLLRRAHAPLWPSRSSQGHGTRQPSREGLWTTCPYSASSGYHAEFHEDCYQKHTNPPHNDPYLRL